MSIYFAMELVIRESKSDNNHHYTKLLLPICPMEVLFSPITYIHGSHKFVIDSALLFLPTRLRKKKFKCWGSLLSACNTIKLDSVMRSQTWQCLDVFHWMANNLDGFWNTSASCSTVGSRLLWSEIHLYTSAQPRMAGEQIHPRMGLWVLDQLLWGSFSAPVSTSGKRNLTAGAAQQQMGSDSLRILVTEVVLVHGCGGRFSCVLWAWLCVFSSLWSLGCAIPQAGRCWLSCCFSVLPRRLLLFPGWYESEIRVQLCDF